MTTPTNKQLDGLTEIINIGVGSAVNSLNEILNTEIKLEVPVIKIVDLEKVEKEDIGFVNNDLSCVKISFSGECCGVANLIFPKESAVNLVNAISGKLFDDVTMDDIKAQTLEEIGNIVVNGLMGSISNMIKAHFDVELPIYLEGDINSILNKKDYNGDSTGVLVKTIFKIETLSLEGIIIVVLMVDSFKTILHGIDNMYNYCTDASTTEP